MSQPPRKITLKKIDSSVPPQSGGVVPPPAGGTHPTVPASTPPPARSGGVFTSARAVLNFLGSVISGEIASEAIVRRLPNKRFWVEVDADFTRTATMITIAGGKSYAYQNQRWVELTVDNRPSKQALAAKVDDAPVVDLSELLAETQLPRRSFRGSSRVDILCPSALARIILRQAAARHLDMFILPVQAQGLAQTAIPESMSGAVMVRLRHPDSGMISASFIKSLLALPYVLVGAVDDSIEQRVLVDVRIRTPLPVVLIQRMVPESEIWALGPVEAGRWRLIHEGRAIDVTGLAGDPELPMLDMNQYPASNLPAKIPVQLIERPNRVEPVDGILLDDTELDWMRRYLLTRPTYEACFLMLGAGKHLFISPTKSPSLVPFGKPLTRIGPGALFREIGMDFYPPMPIDARQTRFEMREDAAVAVTRDGAFRFTRANMTPAWSLWVGDAPPMKEGLSHSGHQLLQVIDHKLRQMELQRIEAERKQVKQQPIAGESISKTELVHRAQLAVLDGRYLEAAQLMEQAGHYGEAGQYYERAAQSLR